MLWLPLLVSLAGSTVAVDPTYLATCTAIQNAVSSASLVSYPGSPAYDQDNAHSSVSASQPSTCSVEPGNVLDVSRILRILANTTTPFAVKGGGHALNPGFSSTPGVQIAMSRFNAITYHAGNNTVDLGTGLIWDQVYATLNPLGVNVVGGRVTGIGVAGFSLGGGYSWLTNEHGLTVDTIQAFEIVLPSGLLVRPTATNLPRLFFGLKGGQNNFGIVTKITLTTYPQGQVWGGQITYDATQIDAFTAATNAFIANNNDPKANLIAAYSAFQGTVFPAVLVFYNAPTPPAGLFDSYLAIPSLANTIQTRTFDNLVASFSGDGDMGSHARYDSVSLAAMPPALVEVIKNQSVYYAAQLSGPGVLTSYNLEPFLPVAYTHATPSAWPHQSYRSPFNMNFAWPVTAPDATYISAMKQSAADIRAAAVAEGQNLTGLGTYPNYALGDATLREVYDGNVPALRVIKNAFDPNNVMGRAGGFKF